MINGVTPAASQALQATRQTNPAPAEPVAPLKSAASEVASAPTLAAAIVAAAGPPIDTAKIAAIRAALAKGDYPIDPPAIAAKMVQLDLPSQA